MNNSIKTLIDNARSRAMCNDLQGAEVTLRKAWTDACAQSCVFPIRINSINSLTRERTTRYVPCGHCVNCLNNKRAEWVTRMELHNDYCAKYSYFITLTYKAFPTFEEIPEFLRNAYWRYDDLNHNHTYAYQPCLIRYEHFQKFMKSLRKLHDGKLSFYACSEYGSTYGRPHFHCIIWTDKPLLRKHVYDSWSYNSVKSRKYPKMKYIGRVQFDDLNANGTNGGRAMTAKGWDSSKCFAYVAKYCCKEILDCDSDKNSRFWLFYNDLQNGKFDYHIQTNYVFTPNIRRKAVMLREWASHFRKYVRRLEMIDRRKMLQKNMHPYFSNISIDWQIKDSELIKRDVERQSSDLEYLTPIDNYITDKFKQYVCIKHFYKCAPAVLRKIFAPSCEMSRSVGIGMDYAKAHYLDYSQGKFVLPKKDNVRLVFPRAFMRYTAKKMQGIFRLYYKPLQKSASSLSLLCQKHFDDYFGKHFSRVFNDYNYNLVSTYELQPHDVQKLLRSDLAFTDYRHFDNSARGLIFIGEDGKPIIKYYQYMRSSRQFVEVCSMNYNVWLDDLCNSIEPYTLQYNRRESDRLKNEELYKYCVKESRLIVDTFLSEKFYTCKYGIVDGLMLLKDSQYETFKKSMKVLRDVKYNKSKCLTSKKNLL